MLRSRCYELRGMVLFGQPLLAIFSLKSTYVQCLQADLSLCLRCADARMFERGQEESPGGIAKFRLFGTGRIGHYDVRKMLYYRRIAGVGAGRPMLNLSTPNGNPRPPP